ncbi:hypothetical protein [Pseudomonas sp. 5P_5.1_Bac1]|uniref:hypothetical protein n=1 Tax=Pseudomonas sp. 5P_5.1_Bac1 TaxID=2971616 RepID=UPI0021C749DE|nr:hypothetical protein [Pseudomonas sp. 5P_5.1_Bac1]MCU1724802.1 hypothetical protein [Pseudomonas sp. 5P_5.1_Bac1]
MKKIVPDPPVSTLRQTVPHTHFGSCNGAHPPVFSVHPAADIDDALVHLSAALTSAFETNAQLCEMLERPLADLAWSTWQSLEICQALTEALRNRGEQAQAQG